MGESVLRFDSKCYSDLFGKIKIELLAICYKEKLLPLMEVSNKNQRVSMFAISLKIASLRYFNDGDARLNPNYTFIHDLLVLGKQ